MSHSALGRLVRNYGLTDSSHPATPTAAGSSTLEVWREQGARLRYVARSGIDMNQRAGTRFSRQRHESLFPPLISGKIVPLMNIFMAVSLTEYLSDRSEIQMRELH